MLFVEITELNLLVVENVDLLLDLVQKINKNLEDILNASIQSKDLIEDGVKDVL